MTFEVCLQSVDGAVAAQRGGARRVELCAALIEGGLTPSLGTISACRDAVDIDVMVMIRPRGGDFHYTEQELDIMERDVRACREIGVTGVVFGLLNTDGSVAGPQVQRLVQDLIDLGITRILTSGQQATVPEGADLIRRLIDQAGNRMEILPGCGITPENVADMITATGASQFHATAFRREVSPMQHRNEKVYMGIPGLPEYERETTSEAEVKRFLSAVNQIK